MKLMQVSGGFTQEEFNHYRFIVYGNIITQMKVLLSAMETLNIELAEPSNKDRAQRVNGLMASGDAWSPTVAEDIRYLWADSGVKKVYELRDKEFQLNDSAEYFFENIERIGADNYQPNDQDVLRARVRSTGIDEAEYEFDGFAFRMIDVGGQRSERRKWIHCFDSVVAVLFCASLNEYNQTLREDITQNRMKESLLLFDEICNSPWFQRTAFILFFTKIDLFREKILRVPLTTCFPNYNGGQNCDEATEFIKQRYLEQNTLNHQLYSHITCAVSTENVRVVFKCVKDTLMQLIFEDIGF